MNYVTASKDGELPPADSLQGNKNFRPTIAKNPCFQQPDRPWKSLLPKASG